MISDSMTEEYWLPFNSSMTVSIRASGLGTLYQGRSCAWMTAAARERMITADVDVIHTTSTNDHAFIFFHVPEYAECHIHLLNSLNICMTMERFSTRHGFPPGTGLRKNRLHRFGRPLNHVKKNLFLFFSIGRLEKGARILRSALRSRRKPAA